jgi:hypothetical protein
MNVTRVLISKIFQQSIVESFSMRASGHGLTMRATAFRRLLRVSLFVEELYAHGVSKLHLRQGQSGCALTSSKKILGSEHSVSVPKRVLQCTRAVVCVTFHATSVESEGSGNVLMDFTHAGCVMRARRGLRKSRLRRRYCYFLANVLLHAGDCCPYAYIARN